jgi:hypothetical protein
VGGGRVGCVPLSVAGPLVLALLRVGGGREGGCVGTKGAALGGDGQRRRAAGCLVRIMLLELQARQGGGRGRGC